MIDEEGRIRQTLEAILSNIGTTPRHQWYVDHTSGNDNYDGLSRESAFSTIGAAVTAADDGDIIHIAEDTFDEAISIPAGKNGLRIICEPGVYLINTTPGTVVAIASDVVYWEGGIIETNGQTGMEVNGDWFTGKDIRVYNSAIGFDMNGAHPLMINCRTNECSAAGFDVSEDSGHYYFCDVHGAAASRGFYLSHTNAHNNIFKYCATLGCTAGGYETVAGADENIFDHCSQSSLCAGPTDAGANNSWPGFSEDSQITAGQSAAQDRADIHTQGSRALYSIDFWSDMKEEVAVTGAQSTIALPTVTIADLPAGATIVRAIAMFKFRMVENTYAGVNKLDAAAALPIQVDDSIATGYVTAIDFIDDAFTLTASTREGGDAIFGDNDIAAMVDGNDIYSFRWYNAKADQANIQFNDVQVGIRIWYSV